MQILNTLTILALVVSLFALFVGVPVQYASTEDSGRSSRLILLGGGPGAGELGDEPAGGVRFSGWLPVPEHCAGSGSRSPGFHPRGIFVAAALI